MDEAKAKLEEALALLKAAQPQAGHNPASQRALSITITHTETAVLWAERALAEAT